jgi:hypothetical protein
MKYYVKLRSEQETHLMINTFNDKQIIHDVLLEFYDEYFFHYPDSNTYWDFSENIYFHVVDYYFMGEQKRLYFFKNSHLNDYVEKKYNTIMRKSKFKNIIYNV